MNKTSLVEAAAVAADLPKAQVAKTLDAVLDTITAALVAGDSVLLVGFGTFAVGKRAARTGRNPKTGEPLKIKASKAPRFSAGKALKAAVN